MKLINKISRYYFINSVVLFLIAFAGIYFALNRIITDEIDEQLKIKNEAIKKKFYSGESVNDPPFVEIITVKKILKSADEISDTLIYISSEKEQEPFHQIISFVYKGGNNYKLFVRTSLIEKEDLIYTLFVIFSIAFAFLIIILFFINRKTTKDIFIPFYDNLNQLKNYSVKTNSSLKLTDSEIDEFNELNLALNSLSEKAVKEYKALKEFSEDLSHELQTLVAVIKSKFELLLQKVDLDEESANNLQSAYHNLNKLDKLNRSLILLAKLESRDFFDAEKIELKKIISKVVDNYFDFAEAKKIIITAELNSDSTIECNPSLIETVINNLVSNSIKHNIENGKVDIKLSGNTLEIQNTGASFTGNTEEFFDRFSKASKKSDSTGLGLAIVKKICDLYGYKIEYLYDPENHKIIIYFK
jgi:signal transduction histidine kinase